MATPLPSGYTFGKVVGQAIRAVGDSPDDPDYHPEANPITGKKCVTFTPKVAQVVTPDNGVATMVLQDKIECDMNADGQLIRNGEDPGEIGVWLYTGVWTVAFTGVMSGIQSFDILVTEFHAEDPLDLFANMATPISPSDPVTTLVVPSGGATGDVLTWDPSIGGLKWIARTAFPDAEYVAQAQQAAQTSVDAKNVSVSSKDIAVTAKDDAVQAKNDAETFASNFNTWFLRGNGSPVGVVTPSSAGVQYVDLAATNGARIWVSVGTGITNWRVMSGNTGKRFLEPDITLQQGRFAIQRINDLVILYVEDVWVMSTQASADTKVLTIPESFTVTNKYVSGFTLISPYYWRADFLWSGGTQSLVFGADSTARKYCRDSSALISTNVWPYWPTTLPGIPT